MTPSSTTPTHPRPFPRQRGITRGHMAILCGCLLASIALAAPPPSPRPGITQVYRCTLPDGGVRYGQMACDADEGSDVMQVGDARTKAQTQQGLTAHKRAHKLGRSMQRDRKKSERQLAGRQAIALDAPRGAARLDGAHTSRKKRASASKPDPRAPKPLIAPDFTARVPGSGSKQARKPASDNQPAPGSSLTALN